MKSFFFPVGNIFPRFKEDAECGHLNVFIEWLDGYKNNRRVVFENCYDMSFGNHLSLRNPFKSSVMESEKKTVEGKKV